MDDDERARIERKVRPFAAAVVYTVAALVAVAVVCGLVRFILWTLGL